MRNKPALMDCAARWEKPRERTVGCFTSMCSRWWKLSDMHSRAKATT